MTKRLLKSVLVVVLAATVLSGCSLFGKKKEQLEEKLENGKQKVEEKVEEAKNKVEEKFSGTIEDLLSKKGAMKCTWKMEDEKEGMTGQGVIYVADENTFYQEGEATGNGKTTKMYILGDGEFFYGWNNMSNNGFKMKLEELKEGMDEEEMKNNPDHAMMKDLNSEYAYSCAPWIVDDSKFTPPTDINFVYMEGLMNPAGAGTAPMDPCQICNNLSGEMKTMCLDGCK